MSDWLLQTLKAPEIVAVFLTAVVGLIARIVQPSARVVWGTSHGFTFSLPIQDAVTSTTTTTLVHTGTVFVQNTGRKTAEDIEVVFNYRPQHFQVWPSLNYNTAENPEHHFTIKITTLGPRESTTIELLSVSINLPDPLRVRSPLGEAKRVPIAPMRVWPGWFNRTIFLLLVLGIFGFLYLLVRLIEFISGF